MRAKKRLGLLHLIHWCSDPSNPADLFKILESLTDMELLAGLRLDGNPGRLAWAEHGRRKRFFDFDISVARGVGKVDVCFTAAAAPIHDYPKYQ